MAQRRTIWIAELVNCDNVTCKTKKEAEQLEEKEKELIEIEELTPVFEKYFKLYYGEKDRYSSYRYFCVDCGKKLLEYESEWDGHRSNRGKCIVNEPFMKLFNGFRCPECHKKTVQLFQKMLLFHSKKSDIINLIDITEWDITVNKNEKTVLHFYKVVDFWDKNHGKKAKKREKKVKT